MIIHDPVPDLDPGTLDSDPDLDHDQIAFSLVSGCCRSCAEDLSDRGTLLVWRKINSNRVLFQQKCETK